MATDRKLDRDKGSDHDHDNDNEDRREGKAVAPAPAAGALTSLAALQTALNNVDTASVGGRSGLPMMQFKSRENAWSFGQRRTTPEDGSRWALNPLTFQRGYICFSNDNKVLGERLVPVSQEMPDPTTLPDKGADWQEEWAVNLKCLTGVDGGTEVVFKSTTVGGIQAINGVIDMVRDRLNGGQHGGKVAPVLHIEKGSYPHGEHGRIPIPVFVLVEWISLDGPAPAPEPEPEPAPTPAAQPRRRRVG